MSFFLYFFLVLFHCKNDVQFDPFGLRLWSSCPLLCGMRHGGHFGVFRIGGLEILHPWHKPGLMRSFYQVGAVLVARKSKSKQVPQQSTRAGSLAGLAIPVSFNTTIIRTCHHKLCMRFPIERLHRTILLRMSLRVSERFYCHDWYVEELSLDVFITGYLFGYSNT